MRRAARIAPAAHGARCRRTRAGPHASTRSRPSCCTSSAATARSSRPTADRRRRRQRLRAALRRQRRAAARRRAAADRRRLRARRLRLRHHAHLSRSTAASAPAQREVYELVLAAQKRGDRRRCARARAGTSRTTPRCACWRRACSTSSCSTGTPGRGAREGDLQALLHAPHRPLARARRARRRRLQARRASGARSSPAWRSRSSRASTSARPTTCRSALRNIGIRIEDDVVVTAGRLRGDHRRSAEGRRRHRSADARCPRPGIDVLIRGAGPVGCALALALRESRT